MKLSRKISEGSQRKSGIHMEPQAAGRGMLSQGTLTDHGKGPATGLLGGLKDTEKGSSSRLRMLPQKPKRPQKHGGMGIMTAGVHHAGNLRPIGDIFGILNGEGIHIPPNEETGARQITLQRGDNARCSIALGGYAKLVEMLFHFFGGTVEVEIQLGVLVQIPPDTDHPREDLPSGSKQINGTHTPSLLFFMHIMRERTAQALPLHRGP
jgi:hypothetical protein